MLAGVGNRQSVDEFSREQMLDRLRSLFSAPPQPWPQLLPPDLTTDQTPDSLAMIISRRSWQIFRAITFEDLVQYTLGHYAASVENFVHFHAHILSRVVSKYLYLHPAQRARYHQATIVSSTFHFLDSAANFSMTGVKEPESLCLFSILARPSTSHPVAGTTRASVITLKGVAV